MMDSNIPCPPHSKSDTKNAFRKPSGDAANRNYRRRSPVEGSPSPDASPRHGRSSSPNPVRENSARVSHHHSRNYDDREQGQQYGRNHYGRSNASLRHSDRQSSKSSYGHSRHDKYANEDRYCERLLSRSGHESRDDHMREESDSRSKNYQRSVDKYSRDKYDRSDHRSKEKRRETYLEHQKYKDMDSSYDKSASGKRHALYDEVEREGRSRDWDGRNERRDSRRSSGDYRSDQAVCYSDSRNQKRDDSGPQRDTGKFSLKEVYKSKESNDQNLPREGKRKHDDTEIGKGKDWQTRKAGEQCGIEDKESSGKKLKLFDPDKDDNYRKDDESKTSNSKLSHESKADLQAAKTSGFDGDNDLDAAKVAAMRAAELVNRNLVGAGCLTTDQKKKLLWGGKRSTPTEESGHRWDTAMFSDRERQEKFNKLMGMRGEANVELNSNQSSNDILRAEKQKELQMDLEKQYTAGLRRRDGRTVGLGL
ncbi:starmaker isoform X1 [Spatholobus suberectus]|nr:starmaker isoform X1 [Spatholobus suberectus]